MSRQPGYWAVIPAAGAGVRMGTDIPKQYYKIHGKYILEYSLETFLCHADIKGIVVALADDDPYWQKLAVSSQDAIMTVTGGKERCHSVLNGLRFLQSIAHEDDWVLVHDAARPCLRSEDIDSLITASGKHPVGAVLAVPAKDTMKRADLNNEINETVNRDGLWHAQTPQMFRVRELEDAITSVLQMGFVVTDEAQAMELTGKRPLLVEGHQDNIKVTIPDDLALAELFLTRQGTRR